MSSLDGFVENLEMACLGGCHNGVVLRRGLTTKGFAGSMRVVTERATRRHNEDKMAAAERSLRKPPSARRVGRMMTS
jgi:hypothetical protein